MSKKSKPTASAERQRLFKKKMRGNGFKQVALWIHQADFEAGAIAASSGADPLTPPDCISVESWQLGYMKKWRESRAQSDKQSGEV